MADHKRNSQVNSTAGGLEHSLTNEQHALVSTWPCGGIHIAGDMQSSNHAWPLEK
jgi:hypothetical protein